MLMIFIQLTVFRIPKSTVVRFTEDNSLKLNVMKSKIVLFQRDQISSLMCYNAQPLS